VVNENLALSVHHRFRIPSLVKIKNLKCMELEEGDWAGPQHSPWGIFRAFLLS
jgi:hypothetical protein